MPSQTTTSQTEEPTPKDFFLRILKIIIKYRKKEPGLHGEFPIPVNELDGTPNYSKYLNTLKNDGIINKWSASGNNILIKNMETSKKMQEYLQKLISMMTSFQYDGGIIKYKDKPSHLIGQGKILFEMLYNKQGEIVKFQYIKEQTGLSKQQIINTVNNTIIRKLKTIGINNSEEVVKNIRSDGYRFNPEAIT